MKSNKNLIGILLASSLFFNPSFKKNESLKRDKFYNAVEETLKETSKIDYKYDSLNVNDPRDYWQTPKETLDRRTGDCEDFLFLEDSLLRDKEIKAKLRMGYKKATSENFHGWAEYRFLGRIYLIDPTENLFVDKEKFIKENKSGFIYEPKKHNNLKNKIKNYYKRTGRKLNF